MRGFYGLILGNTFNKEVAANYDYSPGAKDALFCFNHDALGRVCTRASYAAHRVPDPPTLATLKGDRVEPLLFLAQTTRIAPHKTVSLSARAPAGYFPGDDVQVDQLIDDPRWSLYSDGLGIHRGYATVDQDGMLDIPCTNVTGAPITIGELTPFAYVEDIRASAEFEAAEIVSQIHVGPDVTASPGLSCDSSVLSCDSSSTSTVSLCAPRLRTAIAMSPVTRFISRRTLRCTVPLPSFAVHQLKRSATLSTLRRY